MTDNEFNLEFNKKLLYYRENVVATVYITIWAKISFAFAVTYTQLMHDVARRIYVCIRRACTACMYCVHITAKAKLVFAYIVI